MTEAKIVLILFLGFLIISSSQAIVAYQIANEKNHLMARVEQATITNVSFNSDNSATVSIKNTGSMTVVLWSAYVNSNRATIDVCEAPLGIPRDKSANFIITVQNDNKFYPDLPSEFKIRTAKGSSMTYQATYNSSIIIAAPNHVHSQNPLIPPTQPVYGKVSLFGFGWATTAALILGIIAASYSTVVIALFKLNRKDRLPKEIFLVFLIIGDIFLIPPINWLAKISLQRTSVQAIFLLLSVILAFCAFDLLKMLYRKEKGKAFAFFFLLVLALFLSFITVFGIIVVSNPMPIGL